LLQPKPFVFASENLLPLGLNLNVFGLGLPA